MSIYEQNLGKNIANYSALSPLSFLQRSRKVFPEQIAIEYNNYNVNYDEVLYINQNLYLLQDVVILL